MIGNNPRISRTVRIWNFHIWKFVALFSSDGMLYRWLEAGIELDEEGFDPDGGSVSAWTGGTWGGEGGSGMFDMGIDLRAWLVYHDKVLSESS